MRDGATLPDHHSQKLRSPVAVGFPHFDSVSSVQKHKILNSETASIKLKAAFKNLSMITLRILLAHERTQAIRWFAPPPLGLIGMKAISDSQHSKQAH